MVMTEKIEITAIEGSLHNYLLNVETRDGVMTQPIRRKLK